MRRLGSDMIKNWKGCNENWKKNQKEAKLNIWDGAQEKIGKGAMKRLEK
ncbi:14623_t:CDS:1, partial [Cetraspora pellucida]